MKVAIYSSLDGAPSIDRYAREVSQAFPPDVEVEVVSAPTRGGLRGKLDKYFGYLLVARRTKADYNIIVSEGYAFLLLALDGARTLVVCHDVHPLIQPAPTPPGFWRARYKLNLRMLRWAKCVVTVSEHTKQDLLKHCPFLLAEDVVALHNGLRPDWATPPDASDMSAFLRRVGLEGKTFVLHVGNDNWYKNFAGTLRAFASLADKGTMLVKVGDIGAANQGLLQELRIKERTAHIPRADNKELSYLYHAAKVLVFPSWHEGFGWPPLEAMACGCPVVSSDRASLPEVCGDACLYVAPDDSSSITRGMERVLSDEALRAELIAKGRAQAQRFSWRDTAKGMLARLQGNER